MSPYAERMQGMKHSHRGLARLPLGSLAIAVFIKKGENNQNRYATGEMHI